MLITNATANAGSNIEVRGSDEIIVNASQGEVVFATGSNVHLFIHSCNHSGNSFRQVPSQVASTIDATTSEHEIEKPITKIAPSHGGAFTYFPNPFTDHLHIDFLLEKSSPVLVSVYNPQGQLIEILAKGNYEAGEHELPFNNPSVKTGLYFVRLEIGDKHYTKAVVKTSE